MTREAASGARLVYGFHAVMTGLRSDPGAVLEVLLDESRRDGRVRDLEAAAERAGVRLRRVPVARLQGLVGDARHQGVVARVVPRRGVDTLEQLLEGLGGPALLLVLDGVTDPHNLGACLRVANAAGAHAVIAPRDRAVGITPTVSKVASGAAEVTPYLMVTNLARTIDALKRHGIWVVGADAAAGSSLHAADLPESVAWVLGAEGGGMRRLTRERCDLLVRIPMMGAVDSLNVSVASGLVLYESVRRRLPR